MASWYPQVGEDGKLRLPYNRLLLNRRARPMGNRAEMDYKSYQMLGGDEGPQPSLVKYSDPKYSAASIRYNVKTAGEVHYKAQLAAINVKFLRDKTVPYTPSRASYTSEEGVAAAKIRVSKGTLDSKKKYHVTSASVTEKYKDVDYTVPRPFVHTARYRYQ